MFKMDLILKNSMAQIYLTSYLLRGKWSTVALPIEKRFVEVFVQYALIVITTIELFT
jgi:hypothetical protein